MLTPQLQAKQLAEALGLKTELYLKREDLLEPYGSHKGRSIPTMVEHYTNQGQNNFCISSSGNAALAAIYAIKDSGDSSLHIFVGKHIPKKKLEMLKEAIGDNKNITIEQVEKPKQMAFKMDKEGKAKNLRQSTDDLALVGYETLAKELAEINDLAAVFIPTSSGTTAQGLYNGFKKLGLNPEIHIVQTPACHPLIDSSITGTSIANAIVDKIGYRKAAIQKVLEDSNGGAWIAEDKDILEIISLVKEKEGIDISESSALSLVGLKLAIKKNREFTGPVVCLITGR